MNEKLNVSIDDLDVTEVSDEAWIAVGRACWNERKDPMAAQALDNALDRVRIESRVVFSREKQKIEDR